MKMLFIKCQMESKILETSLNAQVILMHKERDTQKRDNYLPTCRSTEYRTRFSYNKAHSIISLTYKKNAINITNNYALLS